MSGFWEDDYETGGGSSDTAAPDMTADEYGGTMATGTEDFNGPPTEADLQESLRDVAFAGYEVPSWSGIAAPAAEYAKRQGVGESAQPQQESRGLIGRITDFANSNKSLTEMVLKGIGGAVAAKGAQKANMAQIQEKDRLEQQRNAQYSASIANLAKPGIIGRQQALRRIDGTPVFNNGRIA